MLREIGEEHLALHAKSISFKGSMFPNNRELNPPVLGSFLIELSPHAKKRVEERKVSIEEIEEALLDPDELLWDVEERHYVAVSYGSKLIVVFDKIGKRFRVVTAFRSSKLVDLVGRRKKRGRWVEVQLR